MMKRYPKTKMPIAGPLLRGGFGIVTLLLLPSLSAAIPIPMPGLGDLVFWHGPFSLAGWSSLAVMLAAIAVVILYACLFGKKVLCPDLWRGLLACQFLFFLVFACLLPLMNWGRGQTVDRDLHLIAKCIVAIGVLIIQSAATLVMSSALALVDRRQRQGNNLNAICLVCALDIVLLIGGLIPICTRTSWQDSFGKYELTGKDNKDGCSPYRWSKR